MAYKKLIKVSNVCQVLDKSKYNPSQTINGITFTNNGDGTFTVNGTATDRVVYGLYAARYFPSTSIGHKCLIESNVPFLDTNIMDLHAASWEYSTRKPIGTITKSNIYISVYKGYTVNNIIFKPQLFDLTEMYGAEHEPTTVEQFRQDFPEEMYDYSPHCWLTSYKRVFITSGGNYLTSYQRNLTCKTKNLFDINSAKKVSGISFSKNGNQITASQTRAETWKSANVLLDTSLVGKTISVTALAMTSGLNKTYIRIQWLDNNGLASGRNIASNMITGNSFQKLTLTGIVPESPGGDFTNLCIMFYSNTNNSSLESGVTYSATFTNIQIELGDTATDYVPYGHL